MRLRELLPAASFADTTARYDPAGSFLRPIRPLKAVPPVPAAAVRVGVPARLQRVHLRARRLLGRFDAAPAAAAPGSFRSIRRLTVAASDKRHLKRVPTGDRRRPTVAVRAATTRRLLRARPSRVGSSVSAVVLGVVPGESG